MKRSPMIQGTVISEFVRQRQRDRTTTFFPDLPTLMSASQVPLRSRVA
jgi:hypothetical protein